MESQYHKGDTVKIIDYGEITVRNSPCSNCRKDDWWDSLPQVVGREGKVEEVIFASGIPLYVLSGIPEKDKWYDERQLKKVII